MRQCGSGECQNLPEHAPIHMRVAYTLSDISGVVIVTLTRHQECGYRDSPSSSASSCGQVEIDDVAVDDDEDDSDLASDEWEAWVDWDGLQRGEASPVSGGFEAMRIAG